MHDLGMGLQERCLWDDHVLAMSINLFQRKHGRAGVSNCDHPERLKTVNYGLERNVCVRCGDVTVRDLGHSGSGELFRSLAPVHQR